MTDLPALPGFELDSLLGTGACGRVFAGRDMSGRRVAIKLLHPDLSEERPMRRRFINAARKLSQLDDDGIARVLSVGEVAWETGVAAYTATELCAGQDLAQELAENELTIEAVCEIGVLMCLAVQAGHDAGLFHLDLKPHNVMVAWNGSGVPRVQVLDFGLSSALFSDEKAPKSLRWVQAAPAYQPPELMLGAPPTSASDVYSLGAIVYEMLAGAPPLEDADEVDMINSAACGSWVPLTQRNARLPEALVRGVENALLANPDERLATPAELMRHLLPHIDEDSVITARARRYLANALESELPEEPTSPSLMLRRAPRPRRISQMPSGRLLSPVFPKSPPAPRFAPSQAPPVPGPRPTQAAGWSSLTSLPAAVPVSGHRFDLYAVLAGLGMGLVLIWLNVLR